VGWITLGTPGCFRLMFFTQEKAVYLNSAGIFPWYSRQGRGKIYRSCQKHESFSLHDLLSTGRHFGCSIYNKPNVRFKHNFNPAERCGKYLILHYEIQLHFSPVYFLLQHIFYCSQTRDSRLLPEQTTAKVNCTLVSHCQYRATCGYA
jgi:hypothetical protein